MSESAEQREIGDRLATIRVNLERMREESRASLRRLAETREAADVSQLARDAELRPGATPPAAR